MNLLWLLLGTGLVLGCEWESLENRTLELIYSPHLGDWINVTDAEECKTACCSKEGCDAAMVGGPQDEPLKCYLVTCRILGSDLCRLRDQPQGPDQHRFQVHRMRKEAGSESTVKPLLGELKPQKDETKQKDESGESKEVSFDLIIGITFIYVIVREKRLFYADN